MVLVVALGATVEQLWSPAASSIISSKLYSGYVCEGADRYKHCRPRQK